MWYSVGESFSEVINNIVIKPTVKLPGFKVSPMTTLLRGLEGNGAWQVCELPERDNGVIVCDEYLCTDSI